MIPATLPVRDLFAGMNKTERRRGIELEAMKRDGLILDWWFERWTFKLGEDTRYTPDFIVQYTDGCIEAEEIKGFWRDDAKVKARVFVELFPMRLRILVAGDLGDWKITEFSR